MSDADTFGPIFVDYAIESAVVELIKAKLDDYMAAVQRGQELQDDYFPHIAEGRVVAASELDAKPGNVFPCITVVAPGTIGDAERHGDGTYRETWGFGIVVEVESTDQPHARHTAACYVAALVALIEHNKSLSDIALQTTYKGRAYDDTPINTSRTIGVGMIKFETVIDSTVDWLAQPNVDNEPIGHPEHHTAPDDYPTVETAAVSIDIDTF